MANTNGMTQKEMFATIMELCSDHEDVVAFCEKKIEQLSKPRKRKENTAAIEFANDLFEVVSKLDGGFTAGEATEAYNAEIAETGDEPVKVQKVSAALRRLLADERVTREKPEDAKSYIYSVA